MSLFRGMADDMPLNDWLQNKVWPAEARWVNEQFVFDGTLLAAAEMLRSGTTCFADMYYYPDIAAKAAKQAGIRACIGLIVLDFPTVWAADADEYLRKGLALRDELAHETLISTIFAPHAPYTVSDEPLEKIRMFADELDLQIMCHVHETAQEVEAAVQNTGKRPLQRLNELGLVSPALNAVHMTQLTEEEIQLVADTGAHVIHCPESNLKLVSGYCPVHALLQAGVNVALGTDGAASNNDLDLIGEMRSAALLAKSVAADASAVPAYEVLKMATINAARALGLAENLGSLEAGKAADLVAIDLNALKTQPVYDPVSQIVYAADSTQVSDVWVAGKHVLHNGELTTLDTADLIQRAQQWRDKII
jgi:5-methylthioadenosine/S-adenosylhomocysteine deaminase